MLFWGAPRRPVSQGFLLVVASAVAWGLLYVEEAERWPANLCSASSPAWAEGFTWPDAGVHWVLMVVAMMFPLLGQPLRHLHDRSLARRRTRAQVLFLLGYTIVWLLAGPALQVVLRVAQRAVLIDGRLLPLAVAALWQVSPAKQWFLNRCHRQPRLSAFGSAADRDALSYGLTAGVDCVGACWALMLLPLLFDHGGHGHLLGMAAVTLFTLGERLEAPIAPAWGWHGPNRALRIVMGRAASACLVSFRRPLSK